jgi:hypothetical protein
MHPDPHSDPRPGNRGELIRRFFAGITQYTFHSQLGVADPPLIDYIVELLIRFLHSDDIYSIRNVRGGRLLQVTDMLAEAQARQGAAKRQVHRHIGDFILFWTGIYPEMVDRMRSAGTRDSLIDYGAQGKRAYMVASTIPVEKEAAPSEVLQRLSQQFDLCVYGLGEVRRQWDERGEQEDGFLLLE